MSEVPQQPAEAVKPLEFTPIEVAEGTEDVKPVFEQAATEEVKATEPVSAGVLGYKAPGLLK